MSQQVKIRRGDEISSIVKYGLRNDGVLLEKNQTVERRATVRD